jgi:membrane-associated phospholipid phosphatase
VTITPTLRHLVVPVSLAAVWSLVLATGTGWVDRWILLEANLSGHPQLRSVATAVTQFGGWVLLTALTAGAAAILVLRRRYQDAALAIAAILAGRLLVELQKLAIERTRPDAMFRLVDVDSFSFPSGHAANSMITYLTLAIVLASAGKWRRYALATAFLLSLVVGLTRIMLGVHWPTDVVAGWAFGLLWVVLIRRGASFSGRPKLIDNPIV